MSKYNVNIVGEPFLDYVGDQIEVRQEIQGSGIADKARTQKQIQYLNGKSSWVKVASSVSIDDISRLTNIGFTENQANGLKGTGLAKEFVLFNGTSNVSNPLQRSGVSKTDSLTTAKNYGTAGSDEFGLQAMPGVTGFNVSHNNLGSIRTGELTIRANTRRQFNILELLYVRLGYTILVEWGNSIYFDNNNEFQKMGQTLVDDLDKGWFAQKETTHLEFYQQINKKKEQYQGNYDAFFCKVQNFDWSFNKDGYYEIKLSLVSLGDIVESLRINNLSSNNIIELSNPKQKQVNHSDIGNFIYCNLLKSTANTNIANSNKDYVYVSAITQKDKIEAQRASGGTGGSAAAILPPKYKSFVRLGTFMEWVEKNVIPFYNAGDKQEPMLAVNTDQRNYMRNFPGLVSTNPNICFIRNNMIFDGNAELIGDIPYTTKIFENFLSINEITEFIQEDPLLTGDFTGSPGSNQQGPRNATAQTETLEKNVGSIMNIYLNLDFIQSVLKTKKDSIQRLDFYTFFKAICDGVNSCLGGYVQLEPIVQEPKIFQIVDRSLTVRTGRDGKQLDNSKKSPEIKMFGYDLANNTSNFVKDFSFNTKISKELSSMIAIGAAANNQSNLETSNFFNNLNRGLVDRFAQKITDGEDDSKKSQENKIECSEKKKTSSPKKKYKLVYLPGPERQQVLVEDGFEDVKPEEDTEYVPSLATYRDEYLNYLVNQFGVKSKPLVDITNYFSSNEVTSEQGASALSNYIRKYIQVAQLQLQKTEQVQSTMLGFIPIDINLTLDGLGGVKIYNQLKIDTKFLPQDYPDKVEFVIKGVQHQVVDNEWTTTLSAISKPSANGNFDVSLEVEDGGLESKNNITSEISEDIIFYPPLGTTIFDIRNDNPGGFGNFGASRDQGARLHNGVDYSTNVGQSVFAPISGRLEFTKATETSKLPGVKIIGTGKYANITVYIFYAQTIVGYGATVEAGDLVAKARALDKSQGGDYTGLTDHIHFKVEKGGFKVNPEKLKYGLF